MTSKHAAPSNFSFSEYPARMWRFLHPDLDLPASNEELRNKAHLKYHAWSLTCTKDVVNVGSPPDYSSCLNPYYQPWLFHWSMCGLSGQVPAGLLQRNLDCFHLVQTAQSSIQLHSQKQTILVTSARSNSIACLTFAESVQVRGSYVWKLHRAGYMSDLILIVFLVALLNQQTAIPKSSSRTICKRQIGLYFKWVQ